VDVARVRAPEERDRAPEALAVRGQVAYLWCPLGVATSDLAKAVGQAAGEGVTMRNWSTALKLHAMMEQ
jgi:uncharacterized protein (DUF1697 family)